MTIDHPYAGNYPQQSHELNLPLKGIRKSVVAGLVCAIREADIDLTHSCDDVRCFQAIV